VLSARGSAVATAPYLFVMNAAKRTWPRRATLLAAVLLHIKASAGRRRNKTLGAHANTTRQVFLHFCTNRGFEYGFLGLNDRHFTSGLSSGL
jgi:hypothetical protein